MTQISEAFKSFGISDGDHSVLVVLVHKDEDDKQLVSDMTATVDGRQVPVEDLSSLTDLEKIKKVSLFMTHLCTPGFWSGQSFQKNQLENISFISKCGSISFFVLFSVYSSCIRSPHRRTRLELCWMQLYAEWLPKMSCKYRWKISFVNKLWICCFFIFCFTSPSCAKAFGVFLENFFCLL